MCSNTFSRGIFGQQGTEKPRKPHLSQTYKMAQGAILGVCLSNLYGRQACHLNTLTSLLEYGESVGDS